MTRSSTSPVWASPALCIAMLGVAALVSPVQAQRGCQFVEGSGDMQIVPLSGGARIAYVGTPHVRCADGVEIFADSAIAYTAQSLQHLIGNVRFFDQTGEMTSDEARYFSQQGRLQANGNVFVRDSVQGYTIENGNLVYLRETDFRSEPQIDVTMDADGIQPSAILSIRRPPPDSAALAGAAAPDSLVLGHLLLLDTLAPPAEPAIEPDTTPTPYLVKGNRIFIQGNSYFRSVGNVVIDRDGLLAYGDSADYAQSVGRIVLNGSARVDGDRYDLSGRTIHISMGGTNTDEVRSMGDAELTGDDLLLTSAEILLYLTDGGLDRLVAIYDPDAENEEDAADRPMALADDFEMTADSLDVDVPDEALERIFAAGTARSVSRARDSLNVETLPEIAKTDWLEGDTIVVTFVAADSTASEGASSRQVDRIVARVGARSLYRLVPSDTTVRDVARPPAVHYVVGDTIVIRMADGEVDRMEVEGQTQGIHLEPLPIALADSLASDSTRADTTSIAVPVDTAGAAPTPGRAPEPGRTPGDSAEGPRAPAGPPAKEDPPNTADARRRS